MSDMVEFDVSVEVNDDETFNFTFSRIAIDDIYDFFKILGTDAGMEQLFTQLGEVAGIPF